MILLNYGVFTYYIDLFSLNFLINVILLSIHNVHLLLYYAHHYIYVLFQFHQDLFVYGGLIFLSKEEKDDYNRKYLTAEKAIRCGKYSLSEELKACKISNKEKGKLYRSLNKFS